MMPTDAYASPLLSSFSRAAERAGLCRRQLDVAEPVHHAQVVDRRNHSSGRRSPQPAPTFSGSSPRCWLRLTARGDVVQRRGFVPAFAKRPIEIERAIRVERRRLAEALHTCPVLSSPSLHDAADRLKDRRGTLMGLPLTAAPRAPSGSPGVGLRESASSSTSTSDAAAAALERLMSCSSRRRAAKLDGIGAVGRRHDRHRLRRVLTDASSMTTAVVHQADAASPSNKPSS